ncbi:MAG: cold-shock protein [Erysipelotrichaceae bacterium]|nr:cold-shock protein [Erysipelotrichaceae bacterium]
MTGKVKWFDNTRGFGFLTGDNGEEVFVHYSQIVCEGFKTLVEDQKVTYEVNHSDRGLEAINVMPK